MLRSFFSYEVFESRYVYHTYSTWWFGLSTFRVLSKHVWLLHGTAQIEKRCLNTLNRRRSKSKGIQAKKKKKKEQTPQDRARMTRSTGTSAKEEDRNNIHKPGEKELSEASGRRMLESCASVR